MSQKPEAVQAKLVAHEKSRLTFHPDHSMRAGQRVLSEFTTDERTPNLKSEWNPIMPNAINLEKQPELEQLGFRSDYFRFHAPHVHLGSLYGDDWFALKAETFARFFGTPVFIIVQTVIVAVWIIVNIVGLTNFDLYPFILLNLAFSLQAAYAAPLILLAQTRQADRDKAHAEADARHREDIARASEERQTLITNQTTILVDMLNQNTQLTESIKILTEKLEILTIEVHKRMLLA